MPSIAARYRPQDQPTVGDSGLLRIARRDTVWRDSSTTKERHTMATVSVRCIVDDVDDAIAFHCDHLGFKEEMLPAPGFAMLSEAICAWC